MLEDQKNVGNYKSKEDLESFLNTLKEKLECFLGTFKSYADYEKKEIKSPEDFEKIDPGCLEDVNDVCFVLRNLDRKLERVEDLKEKLNNSSEESVRFLRKQISFISVGVKTALDSNEELVDRLRIDEETEKRPGSYGKFASDQLELKKSFSELYDWVEKGVNSLNFPEESTDQAI